MLKITSNGEALVVEGSGNIFYPNNATLEIPFNSIILVVDDSDMATFRSASNNDVLFSGIISDITIDGENVTRDNIVDKFSAISNVAGGGSGGGTADAYTKAQSDARYAKKSDLESVESDLNDTDAKVDQAVSSIENIESAMDNKQDLLVSGTNIKTINNQSLLGSGNINIEGGSGSSATTYEIPNTLFTMLYDKFHKNGTDKPMGYSYYSKSLTDLVDFSFADLKLGDIVKDMVSNYFVLTFKGILSGKSIIGGIWQSQPHKAPRLIYIDETDFLLYIQSMLPSTKITQDNEVDYTGGEVDLSDYYTQEEVNGLLAVKANNSTVNILQQQVSTLNQNMSNKQDTLVSGTNIKTINGNSILGEGDITITGGDDVDLSNYYTKDQTDNLLDDKADASSLDDYYTQEQVNSLLGNKADSSTVSTLQSQVDAISGNVDDKQDILVSGTNIKTINNQSLLGEGNINIESDVDLTDYYTKDQVDTLFNNYIKTYTEEQFEALTDEQKNDGIIFITNNN